jgi:tRNA (guanine37-N1)-methyltransferase
MIIKILTLFPQTIKPLLDSSIIGRAQKNGLIKIKIFNLRDWTDDKHKQVDDTAYGGGTGMVLKADIIDKALSDLKTSQSKIILLTPQGKTYNQKMAEKLSQEKEIILISGKYEGFDERVRKLVDLELSIGNYILTGGEIPALAVTDSIARLIPGVVGKQESIKNETFAQKNLLDYPEYTKPRSFKSQSKPNLGKLEVPKILLSGDHNKIKKWREKEAKEKSK